MAKARFHWAPLPFEGRLSIFEKLVLDVAARACLSIYDCCADAARRGALDVYLLIDRKLDVDVLREILGRVQYFVFMGLGDHMV